MNFFAQWNEALRQIADVHLNDIGDSARLFALTSISVADAAIAIWDSKFPLQLLATKLSHPR